MYKYREVKNRQIQYIFDKKIVPSIIYNKCGIKDQKVFKEEESIETLETLGLIKNIEEYQINIKLI